MTESDQIAQGHLLDDAVVGGRSIVAGLKGFLAWLASSIAGISAVLYGFGFLITRAHLNMLGLYGFIDYGPEVYLQEGARFFLVVGYQMLRGSAAPLLSLFVVIAALGFTLQPLLAGTRIAAWCCRMGLALRDAVFRIGALLSISPTNIGELSRRVVFVVLLLCGLNLAGNTLSA